MGGLYHKYDWASSDAIEENRIDGLQKLAFRALSIALYVLYVIFWYRKLLVMLAISRAVVPTTYNDIGLGFGGTWNGVGTYWRYISGSIIRVTQTIALGGVSRVDAFLDSSCYLKSMEGGLPLIFG